MCTLFLSEERERHHVDEHDRGESLFHASDLFRSRGRTVRAAATAVVCDESAATQVPLRHRALDRRGDVARRGSGRVRRCRDRARPLALCELVAAQLAQQRLECAIEDLRGVGVWNRMPE